LATRCADILNSNAEPYRQISAAKSAPLMSWLAAGFISAVLVLLVAVPVVVNLQSRAIREKIRLAPSPLPPNNPAGMVPMTWRLLKM
jgi:hypothetical protein